MDYRIGKSSDQNRFRLNAEYYFFEGADYGAVDALEFNRGFVGFKGRRIGGSTLDRFLSWRPSSHVDAFGVIHTLQDQSRAAGTAFVHLNLAYGKNKWDFTTSAWLLMDTGSSFAADTNFQTLLDPRHSVEQWRSLRPSVVWVKSWGLRWMPVHLSSN